MMVTGSAGIKEGRTVFHSTISTFVEKHLHNMVAYGGVDALIWLCRSSKSIKLHHLTTTILAMLAEKGTPGHLRQMHDCNVHPLFT